MDPLADGDALPQLQALDPLSASLLRSFRRASHLNRQIFTRIGGFSGGGRPGCAIMLLSLGRDEAGITQRELADKLHLSAPSVTAMLQSLEKEGLIERWTDDADQRITRTRISAKGRELAESISSDFNTYLESTFGAMSDADRGELDRLLGILADNMEAALEDLRPLPGEAAARPYAATRRRKG